MALSDRLLEELHRALRARDAEYLPPPLQEAELRALVGETVAQTNAKGPQDMGRVMGVLMPEVRSRAEGAVVSRLVREALGAVS